MSNQLDQSASALTVPHSFHVHYRAGCARFDRGNCLRRGPPCRPTAVISKLVLGVGAGPPLQVHDGYCPLPCELLHSSPVDSRLPSSLRSSTQGPTSTSYPKGGGNGRTVNNYTPPIYRRPPPGRRWPSPDRQTAGPRSASLPSLLWTIWVTRAMQIRLASPARDGPLCPFFRSMWTMPPRPAHARTIGGGAHIDRLAPSPGQAAGLRGAPGPAGAQRTL